ncbi:hypothetical protein FKP32DRAFT_918933 [Trametes sanguinea]|nr:hypothetical protein FKP32DRAFT_918933 [Trametes sanguinea]
MVSRNLIPQPWFMRLFRDRLEILQAASLVFFVISLFALCDKVTVLLVPLGWRKREVSGSETKQKDRRKEHML